MSLLPPADSSSGVLLKSSPVLVFLAFAAAYFMSFSLRSVNAVLAPELQRDLGLSHAQLGALSSAYFFSFALMQLPLGVLIDRIGPRRTNAGLFCFAALGCVLFAISERFVWLWVGRAFVGMGVAGGLMTALSAFRFYFAPQRQQQLAAWMLMSGSLGALTATLPVRWALGAFGWRPIFWIAAALILCAIAALLINVPEHHAQNRQRSAQPALGNLAAYAQVFSDSFLWRYVLISVTAHAGFIAFQSLWIGPWLVEVGRFSPDQSASIILVFNFALMFGFLVLGLIAPRIPAARNAPLVVIGALLLILIQIALAWLRLPLDGSWKWVVAALWVLMALVQVPFTLIQAYVGMSFPENVAGRAYAGYNLLVFTGVFLAQWLFGVASDFFQSQGLTVQDALRRAMGSWTVIEALALLAFVLWPWRRDAHKR